MKVNLPGMNDGSFEKHFLAAIKKHNTLVNKVEKVAGTIFNDDDTVNWLNVHKADAAGLTNELYKLNFTDEELVMAEAFTVLYEHGCVLDDGHIDLENASREYYTECLLVGCDEDLMQEWQAYWESVEV